MTAKVFLSHLHLFVTSGARVDGPVIGDPVFIGILFFQQHFEIVEVYVDLLDVIVRK